MKKIIPFRKEIPFNTNIHEILSISLEHTLSKDNNRISGSFNVCGDYRVTEASIDIVPYNFNIPFTIDIDDTYDITESSIDIDDFYYEVLDNKVLVINIDVKVDNIKEILVERNDIEDEFVNLDFDDTLNKDDTSIFDSITKEDNYINYKVYIVRENDTIDTILTKYNITKMRLEEYNDLSNIKLGDKIIIPYVEG